MKKIILLVILFLTVYQVQSVAYVQVDKLYPEYFVIGSNTMSMPADLSNHDSSKGWVDSVVQSLTFNKDGLSNLMSDLIAGGGNYGAAGKPFGVNIDVCAPSGATNWLNLQLCDEDGTLHKPSTTFIPPCVPVIAIGGGSTTNCAIENLGCFATVADIPSSQEMGIGHQGDWAWESGGSATGSCNGVSYRAYWDRVGQKCGYAFIGDCSGEETHIQADKNYIDTKVNDFLKLNWNNDETKEMLKKMMDEANSALPKGTDTDVQNNLPAGGSSFAGTPAGGAANADVQDILNNPENSGAANAAGGSGSGGASNSAVDAVNYKKDSASNSTFVDVKGIINAIKNLFNDDSGTAVPTDSGDPVFPEKKNLTDILEGFYNSIQSLPLMDTLNGIAVTASGTSVLCVDLPDNYGGRRCWDVGDNQSDFNNIGTALLSVVSMLSIISIFRG